MNRSQHKPYNVSYRTDLSIYNRACQKMYGAGLRALKIQRRDGDMASARACVMSLMRENGVPVLEVTQCFDKEQSTVSHHTRMHKHRIKNDEQYNWNYTRLKEIYEDLLDDEKD